MAEEFHGVVAMMMHALFTLPFWLAVAGIATAWYLYIVHPDLPAVLRKRSGLVTRILEKKYGFDASTTGSSPAARGSSVAGCGRSAT